MKEIGKAAVASIFLVSNKVAEGKRPIASRELQPPTFQRSSITQWIALLRIHRDWRQGRRRTDQAIPSVNLYRFRGSYCSFFFSCCCYSAWAIFYSLFYCFICQVDRVVAFYFTRGCLFFEWVVPSARSLLFFRHTQTRSFPPATTMLLLLPLPLARI